MEYTRNGSPRIGVCACVWRRSDNIMSVCNNDNKLFKMDINIYNIFSYRWCIFILNW